MEALVRNLLGRLFWRHVYAVLVALCVLSTCVSRAEEGMWTLDNPPLKQLKERYGFEPSREWLDHIRLSSVRFNDGGSGSFVSADGLVLTNHHVARGQLQKLSTPEKDYVASGFLARDPAEELPCPDLELNVLYSMEDVTAEVQGAVKPSMSDKTALEARKAAMGRIEKESLDKTGLRSDVVSLYAGGEYWLYRYKKYTDIRLVFAPEFKIAFFGGDPDNFTYPRHDLDMAIFRVYENGKPAICKDSLKWNPNGAADGELVIVSGHPGNTDRLSTVAQLEFLRDKQFPFMLESLKRRLDVARQYAARGTEEARQAANTIFGVENSIKAITGQYDGLKDPHLMAKKQQDEQALRSLVDANPAWKSQYGSAWDAIAAAEGLAAEKAVLRYFRQIGGLRLPGLALTIVRYVEETKKLDGERLEEYHESQLDSLRFRLFSPAPIYPAYEEAMLAGTLGLALDHLGPDDPFIKAALGGRQPAEVAKELLAGTRLADPSVRKQLVEGGPRAVADSSDSLINFARRLDPILRELRKWHEETIESVETTAGEKIGAARFAAYGKTAYPDATFTLRLTFGTVKGFPMNGTQAPSKTTLFGLYDRNASFDGKPPFDLPERFIQRKDRLDLTTPLNFVSTCDIIGGNSGSPVINRAGEIVGLVFDGNIESLVGDFVYDDRANRAVAVHTAGMTEVLRKLYDADSILKELLKN